MSIAGGGIVGAGWLPIDHFAAQDEGFAGRFDTDADHAAGDTLDGDENVVADSQSLANATR